MPLTKQQLLIPRVLCIGGKEGEPNDTKGLWITGEIYTYKKHESDGYECYINDANTLAMPVNYPDKFPHLFKPLQWWEKREKSEWPEYVLFTSDYMHFNKGDVYKWESWGKDNYGRCLFRTNEYKHGLAAVLFGHWVVPADLSDYQEYQKQKEG